MFSVATACQLQRLRRPQLCPRIFWLSLFLTLITRRMKWAFQPPKLYKGLPAVSSIKRTFFLSENSLEGFTLVQTKRPELNTHWNIPLNFWSSSNCGRNIRTNCRKCSQLQFQILLPVRYSRGSEKSVQWLRNCLLGAMENWALITYKEQYLILDESAHPRERFDSLRVIAHELGHQFFGWFLFS